METNQKSKSVTFPPLDEVEAARVQGLLTTMGEFMEVKFKVKEIKVLEVEFDGERGDVAQILQKLAANKKKRG